MRLPLRKIAPRMGFPSLQVHRPDEGLGPGPKGRRTLRIYFIKPSQYDDEGYVLRYQWGVVPNNTLSVLAGLNDAYARSHSDIHIQTVLWDELVGGVISNDVVRSIRQRAEADGVEVLVGLAGVLTGQYPRGRDLALQFRRLNLPVLMGGFHVSSDLPSRRFLTSVGVTVVVGEAETTWPAVLDDYRRGQLQLSYAVTNGMRAKTSLGEIAVPVIHDVALPAIDSRYLSRFFNPTLSTIDTSRGCPFACSFCAVKNVMGRSVRSRDPNAVVNWVRDAHDRHGVSSLFIVDDDLYRSPQWERILDGIAELRRSGREIAFMMQADVEASVYPEPGSGERETPCHRRSKRFVELAAAAGCYAAFVGFESFNPANLELTVKVPNQAGDRQHRSAPELEATIARVRARYKNAVDNWHRAGVGVHCGYMIGLPFDGKGSGRQAARDLVEIGVDIASFFPYTPLPGTEDYEEAMAAGIMVERDFNCWDCLHVVNQHPILSPSEVYKEYCDAHREFYTWRRLAWCLATYYGVPGLSFAARYGMLTQQIYYTYAYRRGWHPMMGGIWRVRDPSVRRQARWNEEAARLYLGTSPQPPGMLSVCAVAS